MLPVLDDRKHYWIGDSEIDKLLRRGSEWLPSHPDCEPITRRYLRFTSMTQEALVRLTDNTNALDVADDADHDSDEDEVERPLSLSEQRTRAVTNAVIASGGGRVVDLGCGERNLIKCLSNESSIQHVLGVDTSPSALSRAEIRLRLDEVSERQRNRVSLVQGALTYIDHRIAGLDVATLIEVIEHIDTERLDVLTQVLFGHASPTTVIVTTPNQEYNVHFERVGATGLRHKDHRFEWTRDQFAAWSMLVCEQYGYSVEHSFIGPDHETTGPPTQMALFRRGELVTQ